MGGGTILDLGVYAIQLACFVFNHEKPTSIKALGHLNDEGMDMSMSASIAYTGGRTVTIFTHCQIDTPCDAYIFGTKGTIHLPLFWCPTVIHFPDGPREIKLPESKFQLNYPNTTGFSFEAAEVRNCIKQGRFYLFIKIKETLLKINVNIT